MYRGVLLASRFQVEQLVDLTGVLLELATDLATLTRVPEVLARGLDLGPLGFALVDVGAASGPAVRILEVYGVSALGPEFTVQEQMRAEVLALCQRDGASDPARPATLGENPPARCAQGLSGAVSSDTYGGNRRQVIMTRQVDAAHRLILLIHHRPYEIAIPQATLETLQVALDHLARALGILMSCQHYPPCLGAPFTRLTEREWSVLCSLNSAGGEKQLADHFGLSPHTLHTHVKSIYRKLGVQGRLPLLHKFRRALQDYRLDSLCFQNVSERSVAQYVAI